MVAGEAANLQSPTRSGEEEEKESPETVRCGGSRHAAASHCVAKLEEAWRGRGESSPGGRALATNSGSKGAGGLKALSARGSGECGEREEEGTASPYIGRRDSGLATAGPLRFSSWAATWRGDTRAENNMPQGGRTDPERQRGSSAAP
jgi:hypothetical protein